MTQAEKVLRRMATVDHVIPRSKGGSNDDDNLVIACYGCNYLKADQVLDNRAVHAVQLVEAARVLQPLTRGEVALCDRVRGLQLGDVPAPEPGLLGGREAHLQQLLVRLHLHLVVNFLFRFCSTFVSKTVFCCLNLS